MPSNVLGVSLGDKLGSSVAGRLGNEDRILFVARTELGETLSVPKAVMLGALDGIALS